MAYQLIARHAAEGKDLDTFLRMMSDAHHMLQLQKDEAGEGRAPIHALTTPEPPEAGARRRRSRAGTPRVEAPATTTSTPSAAIPSGAIVTADGKVYE